MLSRPYRRYEYRKLMDERLLMNLEAILNVTIRLAYGRRKGQKRKWLRLTAHCCPIFICQSTSPKFRPGVGEVSADETARPPTLKNKRGIHSLRSSTNMPNNSYIE